MVSKFSDRVISWQKAEGRQNLPWQLTQDPYLRWVAEIMLQQTQVTTVIPYYEKFSKKFPTVSSLAAADEDEVLALWSGLGYYRRAVYLHKGAVEIVERFGGKLPMNVEELSSICGIGRSTAGAVISACTGRPEAILDGNVKRVLSRYFAAKEIYGTPAFDKLLWQKAQELLPKSEGDIYSQGMMDLGSMICLRNDPLCLHCPVNESCQGLHEGAPGIYPIRVVKKAKPLREVYMQIWIKDGRVFLEKRPKDGVWGGLWSLPECDIPLTGSELLTPFKHVFTHFILTVRPILCQGGPQDISRGAYFSAEDLEDLALPSPVRKFLGGSGLLN